jgi:hypothetical protein
VSASMGRQRCKHIVRGDLARTVPPAAQRGPQLWLFPRLGWRGSKDTPCGDQVDGAPGSGDDAAGMGAGRIAGACSYRGMQWVDWLSPLFCWR